MSTYQNLNKAFYWVVEEVLTHGEVVKARGSEQKELCFYNVTIDDPTDLLITYPSRKFKPDYAITEWLWYLSHDRSTKNIGKMAKIWDMIKDERGECESNYGTYMFPICAAYPSQWEWVVNELKNDKDSRRATIAINQPYHKNWDQNSKDIPCTQFVQFFIRNDELTMGVYMRSNDVVFGFCNDIFTFALFHQLLYNDLKSHYPNLKLGRYSHNAGSMHIYERHYNMAENIMKDGAKYYSADSPKIKLNSDITSEYILKNKLYLPSRDMDKDEIINKSNDLKRVLIEEVTNG